MNRLLDNVPRFLFFTGKGGVGKTSLSCAAALVLAERGGRILLVSTDPASNLDQALEAKLTGSPTQVAGTANLWAMNIDPRQAAAAYRERVVGPVRGVLPDAAVAEIEEQLSGACTVELAAFDEFSRLMTDSAVVGQYDHVVFDTAPTGHTLRLLKLPSAWKGYLDSSSGNASCLGPMSGLNGHRQQFEDTLNTLADMETTRLVLVARPDQRSLAEAARTSKELAELGLGNQWLAVNGILGGDVAGDPVAQAMRDSQTAALEHMPEELRTLPLAEVQLSPTSPIGVSALRRMLSPTMDAPVQISGSCAVSGTLSLTELLDGLDTTGGVIMTMGKGGVGKTTLASRIAVEMAARGAKVHLTTSDPAAHLDVSLAERHRNLRVSRIDPLVETKLYRQEIMSRAGKDLDAEGRRLLEEDLRSPCTEEIAVFRAFARVVDEAKDSVVVVDTAPTGHTILLLDATEAYHRDVSRNSATVPDEVKFLLPRLRDPRFTRILIVTLPEATPVQEASDLRHDLERAGITPYAWIVNQSLSPLSVSNPIIAARRGGEAVYINKVLAMSSKTVVVPWQDTTREGQQG